MNLLPSKCPKCSTLMLRKHRKDTKRIKKSGFGYSQWDFCPNCRYVQHYDCFRVKYRDKRSVVQSFPKKIPRMDYHTYITSAYWISRRRKFFIKFGRKCEVCGSTQNISLHHKKYNPRLFGREPDKDLVSLCWTHHHMFHDNHKTKKNMSKETDLYIYTLKQLEQSGVDNLSWIK